MFTVNKKQTQLYDENTLMAEASELGLPPGQLPDFIAVVNDGGAGFLFRLQGFDGQVANYATDRTPRIELTVFND